MGTTCCMRKKLYVAAEFDMLLGDYVDAYTVDAELLNVVLKRLR